MRLPSVTMHSDGRAVSIRAAVLRDVPTIERLIDASIQGLGTPYYSDAQIASSLRFVFGADSTMIEDGTYIVVESEGMMIGAGGWSFRRTPFGGDQATPVRNADHRQPGKDPAVIRAMFVHPDWARQGIGRLIIETCEMLAHDAGYQDLELIATLSGVAFYERMGYLPGEPVPYRMGDGTFIDFVRMDKKRS